MKFLMYKRRDFGINRNLFFYMHILTGNIRYLRGF